MVEDGHVGDHGGDGCFTEGIRTRRCHHENGDSDEDLCTSDGATD